MKQKIIFCFCIYVFVASSVMAQDAEIYPTNWWAEMKNSNLQLMIHYKNISKIIPPAKFPGKGIKAADGIILKEIHAVENPNYIFLDLVIDKNAKPGKRKFTFIQPSQNFSLSYELKPRRPGNGSLFAQGVTSKDFIYLLMPDRFSNGDESNDRIAGMRDQSLNRNELYARHGGDMQGVINHLDYLQSLGVTALWMTPVLENDRTERTEHGYGFTNQYKIDARLGGENAYKNLSDALHARGMKLIQDAVYNHVDIDYFLYRDMPAKDWFHQWPQYTGTSYKDQPVFDPYASASDRKITQDGWFTPLMPDLNQNNPFVANFLIQHAIWSVETFAVDGWRIDTYLYNDLNFMNRCNKALMDEYPKITMFGETWVHGTAAQAYLADNNISTGFKSNLQGVTDFQTNLYGIVPALTQSFGWTEGVNKLYTTLSNDFLYKNPMRNVNFLDNHDVSRIFSIVGENVNKQKMAIEWLFTCRGIPQMYYGTEVLMKGFTNPDGLVRMDFPGGWNGDAKNAFTGAGLSADETSVQQLVKKLGGFRKNSTALQTGKMMQYVPQDGLYIYFRYNASQTIMCVMNCSDNAKQIDFSKYAERTAGFAKAESIVDAASFNITDKPEIGGYNMWVLELKK